MSIAIVIYSLFAFFITLVREILKDLEDLRGDDTFGCKTLPIVWGIRRTKIFIYVLLMVFSLTIVVINSSITPLPMTFFAWTLFLPMAALAGWLLRADTKRDFYQMSQFCKYIMIAGILSMVFL